MDPTSQHPIPQDITGFKFRLVGDITLKQFAYLAAGGGFAWLFYSVPIIGIIKFPLILICALVALVLAFLPIQGRPADTMIMLFFKSVFKPNQYTKRDEGKGESVKGKENGQIPITNDQKTTTNPQGPTAPVVQLPTEERRTTSVIPSEVSPKADVVEESQGDLSESMAPRDDKAAVTVPQQSQTTSTPNTLHPTPYTLSPTNVNPFSAQPIGTPNIMTNNPTSPLASLGTSQSLPANSYAPQPTSHPLPPTPSSHDDLLSRIKELEEQLAKQVQGTSHQSSVVSSQQPVDQKSDNQSGNLRTDELTSENREPTTDNSHPIVDPVMHQQEARQPISNFNPPAGGPSSNNPLPTPTSYPLNPTPQSDPLNPPHTATTPVMPLHDIPNLIEGSVRDPRGNPLQNILVEVKDTTGNPVRAFKTTSTGDFAASTPLLPGTYTVTFEDPEQKNTFQPATITIDNSVQPVLKITSTDEREQLRKELFSH